MPQLLAITKVQTWVDYSDDFKHKLWSEANYATLIAFVWSVNHLAEVFQQKKNKIK